MAKSRRRLAVSRTPRAYASINESASNQAAAVKARQSAARRHHCSPGRWPELRGGSLHHGLLAAPASARGRQIVLDAEVTNQVANSRFVSALALIRCEVQIGVADGSTCRFIGVRRRGLSLSRRRHECGADGGGKYDGCVWTGSHVRFPLDASFCARELGLARQVSSMRIPASSSRIFSERPALFHERSKASQRAARTEPAPARLTVEADRTSAFDPLRTLAPSRIVTVWTSPVSRAVGLLPTKTSTPSAGVAHLATRTQWPRLSGLACLLLRPRLHFCGAY